MFLLSHFQRPLFAAASTLVALAAAEPAAADPSQANLGPVGPYEPILASVGKKRIIAFYVPEGGECTVHAVVFDDESGAGDKPYSSARIRVTLSPGEMFHLDAVKEETIDLQCGPGAATLAVANRGEVVTRAANAVQD